MKKFSNITGQKVPQEPKSEVKITEADIFKSKVMNLLDDFLRVQIYGPITRYHVSEQSDPGCVLLSVLGGRYLQPDDRGLEHRRRDSRPA